MTDGQAVLTADSQNTFIVKSNYCFTMHHKFSSQLLYITAVFTKLFVGIRPQVDFQLYGQNHQLVPIGWWLIKKSEDQVNSLAPGRPGYHFKTAIFNLVLLVGIFTSVKDNAMQWMPRDLTDDKSTLVQVMAWCRQATSHYLSQCWPSSMSPHCVTRPQRVHMTILPNTRHFPVMVKEN